MVTNLGILVIVVMGLTQFIKEKLKLEGTKAELLSFGIGLGLGVLYQLSQTIKYDLASVLAILVVGLLMGLVPSGIYKFTVTNFSNQTNKE